MALPFLLLALILIPIPSFAADFSTVTYHRCYNGDTCTFTIPGVHPLFGEKISVRLAGIDASEIEGKCEQEKALAKKTRDLVRGILPTARRIDLINAA
jgi:endonuclease YncB( thermonuclease family)